MTTPNSVRKLCGASVLLAALILGTPRAARAVASCAAPGTGVQVAEWAVDSCSFPSTAGFSTPEGAAGTDTGQAIAGTAPATLSCIGFAACDPVNNDIITAVEVIWEITTAVGTTAQLNAAGFGATVSTNGAVVLRTLNITSALTWTWDDIASIATSVTYSSGSGMIAVASVKVRVTYQACGPATTPECAGLTLTYTDLCGFVAPGSSSCNDGNACTSDSCTDGVGCETAPVVCTFGDPCLDPICVPATGCQGVPKNCADADLCTDDACFGGTCGHTPKNCSDGNACTDDNCSAGNCLNPTKSCDDNNACTDESCNTTTGCANTAVPGRTLACYTGSAGTAGVGACKNGTISCTSGIPSACAGQVLPATETCDTIDNDCDGTTDDGFDTGVACDGGDPDSCASGSVTCATTSTTECRRDGPLSVLRFDESAGHEVLDDSGHMLHAFSEAAVTAGKFGSSRQLGPGASVALPDFAASRNLHREQTIAMWIKPTASQKATLVHRAGSFLLDLDTDGSVGYSNAASGNLCSGCQGRFGLASPGNWTHVAATWNGSAVTMYLNGVNVGSNALAGTFTPAAGVPRVGCTANATQCIGDAFSGGVDDLVLYDYALTAAEVTALLAGVPAADRRAPRCGADANCDATTDGEGSNDCTVYYRDVDADGYGRETGIYANVAARWGFEAQSLSDSVSQSAPTRSNVVVRRDGRIGRAVAFDNTGGASSSLQYSSLALPATSSWSFTAHVKPEPSNATSSVLKFDNWLELKWEGAQNRFVVSVPGLGGPSVSAPAVAGFWSSVQGDWSGGTLRIRVNTGTIFSAAVPGTVPASGTGTLGAGFTGQLDEVVVYTVAQGFTTLLTRVNLGLVANVNARCLCAASAPWTATSLGDCNDAASAINPAASEQCNAFDDDCDASVDEGADASCADVLSCTVDSCGAGPACVHTLKAGFCNIGGTCYAEGVTKANNSCLSCQPGVNTANWTPLAAGTACNDGNACTTGDACGALNVCSGTTLECDDNNRCTTNGCKAATGCEYTAQTGTSFVCYDGPVGTAGAGECRTGTITCSAGVEGACVGQVLPVADVCDGKDNDCDGGTDEDFNIGVACDLGDRDGCAKGTFTCNGANASRCVGDGPVVYVPFLTVTASATPNVSFGGKNAALQGGAATGAGPAGFGTGVLLDGNDDYVEVPAYSDLTGGGDGLLVAFWVKKTTAGDQTLLSKVSTGGQNEVFIGTKAGQLVVQLGTQTVTPGIPLGHGSEWIHIAVIATGSVVKVYVGGAEQYKGAITSVPTLALTPWAFGRSIAGSSGLAGGLDELTIHKATSDANLLVGGAVAALEVCDGVDNDCNGTTDEGYSVGAGACDSLDTDHCAGGTATQCLANKLGTFCLGDGLGFEYNFEGGDSRVHAAASGDTNPMMASGSTLVPGKVGNALALDGTGFARLPHSTLSPVSSLGTWSVWVRFDAAGDMTVLSTANATGGNLWSVAREAGHPTLRVDTLSMAFPAVTWGEGTWYHVGLRLTATQATLALDGVPQAVMNLAPSVGAVTGPFGPVVGARRVGAGYGDRLHGAIDQLFRSATPLGQKELARSLHGEACDGTDDDCDGVTDEPYATIGQPCSGSGTCYAAGTNVCNDLFIGERCNGAAVASGTSCDDANACTSSDVCNAAGTCSGSAYSCDDGLECTIDVCQGDGTCAFNPLATSCAIDGACWSADAVKPGTPCLACKPGTSRTAWTPVAESASCSDASACTTGDKCVSGVCLGAAVDCGDGDDCSIDACAATTGCYQAGVNNGGEPCDDGDACTTGSGCTSGVCSGGTATNCDDSNPCTSDSCNNASGCVHTVVPHTQACYGGAPGTKGVGVCKGGLQTCSGAVLGPCVGQTLPSTERCNDLDDNCDGVADEPFAGKGAACDGNDADSCKNGLSQCSSDQSVLECVGDVASPEVCDGVDNDCNGQIDETYPTLNQVCDGSDSDSCADGRLSCAADGMSVTCKSDGAALLFLGDEGDSPLYVAKDQSGAGNDGLAHGAMALGTGVRGGGYVFDGVDDLIRAAATPSLALSKAFTLSVYFKTSGATSAVTLLQLNTGDCADVALRLNASGVPFAVVEESKCGYATLVSGVVATKNVWHHLALVSTGTEYRLFYDGALKKTAPVVGLFESGAVELGPKPFAGGLDEVGVWPYALSNSEVAALYTAGPKTQVETCDGLDNNCDGSVDEHAVTETCDGRDNDCAGGADDTFSGKGAACNDPSDSACNAATQACDSARTGLTCISETPRVLFKFFEGSGTTVVNLAGPGDASVAGSGLTWLPVGAMGPGVRLDGATTLRLAPSPVLDLPGNGATLEIRVKPEAAAAASLIRRLGVYELALDAAGKPKCTFEGVLGGSAASVVGSAALTVGAWQHLACVYDRGGLRLYVQGALVGLTHTTNGGMPAAATAPLDIGFGFAGGVDEVAVTAVSFDHTKSSGLVTAEWGSSVYRRDVCDGLDNDCDAATDEDAPLLGQRCDLDLDGCKNGTYTCGAALNAVCAGDVPVNGSELCNGLDDNCDGVADETFTGLGGPCDGDDADSCKGGVLTCRADSTGSECVGDVNIVETCNALDDDCDGSTDEDFALGQVCDGGDLDSCSQGTWACRGNASGRYCRSDGPLVDLRLDEGTGTTVNSSSGDTGAPTLVGTATWVTEGTGFALAMPDTTEILVADDASLDLTAAVTMAFRAALAVPADGGRVISKGDGNGGRNYQLGFAGNKLRCRATGKAPVSCDGDLTGDLTALHTYACVISASGFSVYQNGVLLNTCPASGTMTPNADPLYIGPITGSTAITLDWARVWGKALSTAEVVAQTSTGEACDGVDNDCDNVTDEGFNGSGTACDSADADLCAAGTLTCTASFVTTECLGDLAKVETCNGIDDDCDGVTDDGFVGIGTSCDGNDADACANGTVICSADGSATVCDGDVSQPELCDGKDNDCNGSIDDAVGGLGGLCEGGDSDTCSDGVSYCDLAAGKVACDEVGARLWLRLDDAASSTVAADSSRHAETVGTLTNATFGVTGKYGTAVEFSAPGRIAGGASLAPFDSLPSFTVAAWVYHQGPFAAGQQQTVVAVASDTTEQVNLFLDGTGVGLGVRLDGDAVATRVLCTAGVAGCTAAVSSGAWHHVAATFSAGQVDLYVDGELVKRSTIGGTATGGRMPGERFTVGSTGPALGASFHGSLDDVLAYPRALTAAELNDLVKRGPTGDAVEFCDDVDNDCDGEVDEGLGLTAACDGPDGDLCATGKKVCTGDQSGVRCSDGDAALWYSLDDGGARLRDSGTLGVDVVSGAGVSMTPGVAGSSARAFDAAVSAAAKGSYHNVLGGQKEASFAAWIRPDGVTGLASIVSQHQAGAVLGRSWAFGRDDDGLFLRLRTSETTLLPRTVVCNGSTACGSFLVTGQWSFVTAVFKQGAATFYANGVLKGTFTFDGFTIANPQPNEPLMVGGDANLDFSTFGGDIDDVRVYRRALSALEIERLYHQSRGLLLDTCDGTDDDCDSVTDEDFPTKDQACDGPDSDLCKNGVDSCAASGLTVVCGTESEVDRVETCNLADDDCDGQTDEGFAGAGDPCDGPDADACLEGVQGCDETGGQLVCLREGPINLWRFDEGSGSSAIDTASTAGNHDLSLNNTLWGTGRFSACLELAGNGGGAKAPVAVGGKRTISLWVKPSGGGYLYGQGTAASFHFGGYWSAGVFTHYHTDNGVQKTVSATVPAGTWTHLAVVMEPGKADGLRVYAGCALSETAALEANTAVGDFTFGRAPGLSDYFKGAIDEVAIYDHTPLPARLCELAAASLEATYANREFCDGLDNDCDLVADNGLTGAVGAACDGADGDACKTGTYTCRADNLNVECVNEVGGAKTEVCNSLDDDCDGTTDEDFAYNGIGVGFPCDPPGECGGGVVECGSVTKAVCSTGPGGTVSQVKGEACDNKDTDCDGLTDEKSDGSAVTENCYTGPGGTVGVGPCKYGTRKCAAGVFGACIGDVVPAATDAECDGLDQNCSGAADEQYKDPYSCTADSCTGGVASSIKNDALCDDLNPCTDDSCTAVTAANGGCSFFPDNSNVLDQAVHGEVCRRAICQGGGILQTVDDTNVKDDGLICTADSCSGGTALVAVLPGYCLVAGACYEAGTVNPSNGCQVCAPTVSTTEWSKYVHIANFDGGVADFSGYTVTELVGGGLTWGVDSAAAATTPNALYFGDPATRTYQVPGARVAGRATSPLIALPTGSRYLLTFQVRMQTEGYTGSDRYDTLFVRVTDEDTSETFEVWDSMYQLGNDTEGSFKQGVVDLSDYAGRNVRLNFEFDSGDAYFNEYEGVYIDQIRVETGCCFNHAQCDTGNGCYAGTCVNAKCVESQICSECKRSQTSLVVLVDRSLSMATNTTAGLTRWDTLRLGLQNVLPDYDERLNLGLKVFPSDGALGSCDVDPGLDVDFHSSSDVVQTYLTGLAPFGQSPIDSAATEAYAAYQTPGAKATAGNKFVLLITDGVESCSGEPQAPLSLLHGEGVKTVVVAFDSTATRAELSDYAVAGGLARPRTLVSDPVYFQAGFSQTDFDAALRGALDRLTAESCNGIDDDCNGSTDDDAPAIACNLDCNEKVGGFRECALGKYGTCSFTPVSETCDEKDNDCDGQQDEDFPLKGTPCSTGTGACYSAGTYVCTGSAVGQAVECNATPIFGVAEVCNNIDDDCDGESDENVSKPCATVCGVGTDTCTGGLFVCNAPVPIAEVCDGLDENCNGAVDDVVPVPCTGVCGNGFEVCQDGVVSGCSADGQPETCNGVDDDCDGMTDEDSSGKAIVAVCLPSVAPGLVGECAIGTQVCSGGVFTVCAANQLPSTELCDGVDNDCNGAIDDTPAGTPIVVECYDPAYPGTAGVGACKKGTRTCDGTGTLGACVGLVTPIDELCNGVDDDCDGHKDEQPGDICMFEAGCSAGACLCAANQGGGYRCYLD